VEEVDLRWVEAASERLDVVLDVDLDQNLDVDGDDDV
jgi:hypothetical protein